MTFEDFLKAVDTKFYTASYKDQLRYGQCIMNELYNVWPSKHNELVNCHVVCFYDNENIDYVLSHLKKEWKSNF